MTSKQSAGQTQRGEDRELGSAASCPSFDALSAYFDGELREDEMRTIRTHVATCRHCAPVISDFRDIHGSLNDADIFQLSRSFVLTEPMAAQVLPNRTLTPVTPLSRIARQVRSAPLLPVMTVIAALLLIAVIASDAWGGDGNPNSASNGTSRVIMVGGVPVEVEDDATFGAASAGSMNGDSPASDSEGASTSTPKSGNSSDWFNWWRPFELILGLTVAALIVTMMSRRRPRHD